MFKTEDKISIEPAEMIEMSEWQAEKLSSTVIFALWGFDLYIFRRFCGKLNSKCRFHAEQNRDCLLACLSHFFYSSIAVYSWSENPRKTQTSTHLPATLAKPWLTQWMTSWREWMEWNGWVGLLWLLAKNKKGECDWNDDDDRVKQYQILFLFFFFLGKWILSFQGSKVKLYTGGLLHPHQVGVPRIR